MAAGKSSARRPRRARARPAQGAAGRLIEAALELAESEGWRRVRLAAVAARARIPLAEALALFPTRAALLDGFFRDIDRRVLAEAADDGGEDSARDRLFDVLMRRFDALSPRKPAVAAIFRDVVSDPLALACGIPRLLDSMAWMLEAAGLRSAGLSGALRAKGLAVIYLNAFRVWLADDTKDMAKTMAALDRGLGWAEGLAQMLAFSPRRSGGEGKPRGASRRGRGKLGS